MKRGPTNGYTLPADKSRKEGSRKITSASTLMPANKVKADWQGETREALLNKVDMLLSGLRDCPRASVFSQATGCIKFQDQTRLSGFLSPRSISATSTSCKNRTAEVAGQTF